MFIKRGYSGSFVRRVRNYKVKVKSSFASMDQITNRRIKEETINLNN